MKTPLLDRIVASLFTKNNNIFQRAANTARRNFRAKLLVGGLIFFLSASGAWAVTYTRTGGTISNQTINDNILLQDTADSSTGLPTPGVGNHSVTVTVNGTNVINGNIQYGAIYSPNTAYNNYLGGLMPPEGPVGATNRPGTVNITDGTTTLSGSIQSTGTHSSAYLNVQNGATLNVGGSIESGITIGTLQNNTILNVTQNLASDLTVGNTGTATIGGTISGTVNIAAGGTLKIGGGIIGLNNVTVDTGTTGVTTITNSGSNSLTFDNSPVYTINNGDLNITNTQSDQNIYFGANFTPTVIGSGNLNIMTVRGDITFGSGSNFNFDGSALTNTGNIKMDAGGSISLGGTFTTRLKDSDLTLQTANGDIIVSGAFDHTGTGDGSVNITAAGSGKSVHFEDTFTTDMNGGTLTIGAASGNVQFDGKLLHQNAESANVNITAGGAGNILLAEVETNMYGGDLTIKTVGGDIGAKGVFSHTSTEVGNVNIAAEGNNKAVYFEDTFTTDMNGGTLTISAKNGNVQFDGKLLHQNDQSAEVSITAGGVGNISLAEVETKMSGGGLTIKTVGGDIGAKGAFSHTSIGVGNVNIAAEGNNKGVHFEDTFTTDMNGGTLTISAKNGNVQFDNILSHTNGVADNVSITAGGTGSVFLSDVTTNMAGGAFSITSNNGDIKATTGTTFKHNSTADGDVTITAGGTGKINLAGFETNMAGGEVSITAGDNIAFSGNFSHKNTVADDVEIKADGTGVISFKGFETDMEGGALAITTNNGNVNFTDAVKYKNVNAGGVKIIAGGNGAIHFSEAAGFETNGGELTIRTTTGNILFNDTFTKTMPTSAYSPEGREDVTIEAGTSGNIGFAGKADIALGTDGGNLKISANDGNIALGADGFSLANDGSGDMILSVGALGNTIHARGDLSDSLAGGDVKITTVNGAISIDGKYTHKNSDTGDVLISAGTVSSGGGAITFGDDIGSTMAGGDFTVYSHNGNLHFNGNLTQDNTSTGDFTLEVGTIGNTITVDGNTSVTLNQDADPGTSAMLIKTVNGGIDLKGNFVFGNEGEGDMDILAGGTGNITFGKNALNPVTASSSMNGGNATISANNGNITVFGDLIHENSVAGDYTVKAETAGNAIKITGDTDIRLYDGDTLFQTAGGDIVFGTDASDTFEYVGGNGSLTLDAGSTGHVIFNAVANISGNLSLAAGTLDIGDGKTLSVTGTTTFAAGTTFSHGASLGLDTGSLTIGANATYDVTGYTGPGTVTVIQSDNDISGAFTTLKVAGVDQSGLPTTSLDKFVNTTILNKSADEKSYEITTGGLVWNNTSPGTAHGTFYVDDRYELGETLADNVVTTAHAFGWDGTRLTKTGSGTLILTADNTYTGTTTVNAGTLQLGSGGNSGSVAGNIVNNANVVFNRSGDYTFGNTISGNGTTTQSAGNLNLAATATIGGTFIQNAGTLKTVTGATLNNATFKGTVTPTGTLNVASATFNGATVDLGTGFGTNKIVATGDIAFSDATVNIDLSGATSNSYELIGFGGVASGQNNVTVDAANLGTNRGGHYFTTNALNYQLIVGPANLTWKGTDGKSTWNKSDTNTNWSAGNISTYFKDGDSVIFDDTAASKDVNLTVDVAPASVTIDTASTYTISGSGKIGGTATVTKQGAGTLNLSSENSYSGGTTLSGGRINIGNNAALGTGTLTVSNGSTLGFAADDLSVANNIAVTDTGTINTDSNDITLSGVFSNTGTLTKTGNGVLTMTGDSSGFGGSTSVDTGTLLVDGKLGGTTTVKSGATLGGSGTVAAMLLDSGSTVSPGGSENIGLLTLGGDTNFADITLEIDLAENSSDQIVVNGTADFSGGNNTLNFTSWANGTYTIVIATTLTGDLSDFNPIQYKGNDLTTTGRHAATLEFSATDIKVTTQANNLDLVWSGPGVWNNNESNKIWDQNGTAESFIDLDAVTFDTTGSRDVTVAPTNVTVADMTVSADGYIFDGGKITGDATGSTLAGRSGKLALIGTNVTTTFKNAIDFKGGIDVGATNTLVFDYSKASPIANDNVITGGGNLIKSGNGELILTADSSAFGGTFTQSAGDLHLAATAALGGIFTQNSGTTFTSDDGATLNNATFKGTVAPAGTLHLASGTFDGATIDFGLLTDRNKIVVAGHADINSVTVMMDASGITTSENFTLAEFDTFDIHGIHVISVIGMGDNRGGEYHNNTNTALMYDVIVGNTTLTWIGSEDEKIWSADPMDRNWETPNITTYFKNGDNVIFARDADNINKSIDVASGGVNVGTMTVTANGYSFDLTKGSITASGNVDLGSADLSVAISYDGATKSGPALVSSGDITINGGKLNVADGDVDVEAVRADKSVEFDIVKSTGGEIKGTGFDDVKIFDSNFFASTYGRASDRYWVHVAYNDQARFTDYSWSHNTNEIARNLDASMNDPAMQDLINGIIGGDALILAGLDTLRGTELAADAQSMALWNPWDIVYKRLYSDHQSTTRQRVLGQCGTRPSNRDAWIEGYYRDTDVRRDGNASKYDGRRGGTMVGIDTTLNSGSKIGIVFGYGQPRVSNRFGKIEADDYTFGLYSKVRVKDELYANAFLGYGRQNYESKRTDIAGFHKAKYDGDSMYASLEFFRSLNWRRNVTLFPLFALDYQRSWTDGFTESGDYGQKVKRADMDRFAMRIGLNSKIRWNDRLNVSTRLQYGYLLGGDVHGVARTQFAAASPTSPVMGLRGVNLGRNQFNVGLGGEWKLTNRTRLFGDYDFDLGDRSTAHTGQFGLVTNW